MTPAEVLLDTDILSGLLNKQPMIAATGELYLTSYGRFTFSLMTRFELLRGLKVKGATTQLRRFNRFCTSNKVLPLTDEIIQQAADIYADLHRRGALIGDADILIAATALVHGLVVVTNNERHFSRIPGLQIENWLK